MESQDHEQGIEDEQPQQDNVVDRVRLQVLSDALREGAEIGVK